MKKEFFRHCYSVTTLAATLLALHGATFADPGKQSCQQEKVGSGLPASKQNTFPLAQNEVETPRHASVGKTGQSADKVSGEELPQPIKITSIGSWLPSLEQGMQWENCRLTDLPLVKIETPGGVVTGEADAMELDRANRLTHFRGHAVLEQPGNRLLSNEIDYDRQREHAVVPGPLFLQQPDMKLTARRGDYYPKTHKGALEQVDYRLLQPRARGKSAKVDLIDQKHTHYHQISYTTCPPGNHGYLLRAKEMKVDRVKQEARLQHVTLSFQGLPIFYSPWLSVPLDHGRHSGFLPPTFGLTSNNGWDLTVPYYFNLAPNYDATLLPRYISQRGLLLGGEFRFLTQKHNGKLLAEVLASDRKRTGSGLRGAFHAQTHSNLWQGWYGDLDINWVSDHNYLRDLGRSLSVTSTSFLRNRGALSYHNREWDLLLELRHYQTLDQNIPPASRPYSLLPRFSAVWEHDQGPAGTALRFEGELVHFHRSSSTSGQRIDLLPRVALPLEKSWGYLEPALSLRYTGYNLSNRGAGQSSSPQRFLYSFTLDGGLYFDRPTHILGHDTTITLEPRLFYTYTPYHNQDDLPLFDTGLFDFTFDNLFRGNRFNGPDRVGDANQIAVGLTSRALENADGRELLRASLGQIYYLRDRRVQLHPDDPATTSGNSSFIAEATSEAFRNWLLRAALQYDPHANGTKIRQGLAQATWHGKDGARFHISWRRREPLLEQTDVAAIWPIGEHFSVIGRWYYSMQENRTVEAVAGLEYRSCCWRARTVLQHFLNGPAGTYNDGIYFEFEFKGLGVLGNNIDDFLKRTIYGY